VVQFFYSFFSFHGFGSCTIFLYVDKFLWLVHSGVAGAFALYVQLESCVQIFRVACVETVSFAQDDVDVVGHCRVRSSVKTSVLVWFWIYALKG